MKARSSRLVTKKSWAYSDEQWRKVVDAIGPVAGKGDLTTMRATVEGFVNNPNLGTTLGELLSRDLANLSKQIEKLEQLKDLSAAFTEQRLTLAYRRMLRDAGIISEHLRDRLAKLTFASTMKSQPAKPNKRNAKPLAQALHFLAAVNWLSFKGDLHGTPEHKAYFEAVVKPVYDDPVLRQRGQLSWSKEVFPRYVANQMRIHGQTGTRGPKRR